MSKQSSTCCGLDSTGHAGELTRIVMTLQPQYGAGMPYRFTTPLWEEEVTLCEAHLSPTWPESTSGPQGPRGSVASAQGMPVRLIWDGETVEE